MDGRLISEYINNKIPNQGQLLADLENKGIEQDKKYILTIKSFGVPTTVLYLLLNDGLKNIIEFQNSLQAELDSDKIIILSHDLPNAVILKEHAQGISNWEKQQSKSVDHLITASGSAAIGDCEWYFPNLDEYTEPLNEVYTTTNQSIEIGRDYIKKTFSVKESDRKYLINVFKEILSFLETTYALQERINYEIKNFTKFFDKPNKIEIPTDFKSICSKRGSVIHNSTFDFQISHKNELNFGNQKIIDYFGKGLEAAEKWIDSTYGSMISELKKH